MTNRAKITAQIVADGWVMVAIDSNGCIEYPQEQRVHESYASVINDARIMYRDPVWDWDDSDNSISIDQ